MTGKTCEKGVKIVFFGGNGVVRISTLQEKLLLISPVRLILYTDTLKYYNIFLSTCKNKEYQELRLYMYEISPTGSHFVAVCPLQTNMSAVGSALNPWKMAVTSVLHS